MLLFHALIRPTAFTIPSLTLMLLVLMHFVEAGLCSGWDKNVFRDLEAAEIQARLGIVLKT